MASAGYGNDLANKGLLMLASAGGAIDKGGNALYAWASTTGVGLYGVYKTGDTVYRAGQRTVDAVSKLAGKYGMVGGNDLGIDVEFLTRLALNQDSVTITDIDTYTEEPAVASYTFGPEPLRFLPAPTYAIDGGYAGAPPSILQDIPMPKRQPPPVPLEQPSTTPSFMQPAPGFSPIPRWEGPPALEAPQVSWTPAPRPAPPQVPANQISVPAGSASLATAAGGGGGGGGSGSDLAQSDCSPQACARDGFIMGSALGALATVF